MKTIHHYHKNGQLWIEMQITDGRPNRIDGPAAQNWDELGQLRSKGWFIEGKRHRIDGPAFQCWDKDGQLFNEEWWINDKKVEPISNPLEWALWVAKKFGNVYGLEKYISEHFGGKAVKAILASSMLL